MKRWWQCMAFVMAVATPAFAQDPEVGTRLRVTRANGKSITGQLAALDEQNFTLRDASGDSKQVVVSREDIQRIEISRAPSRKGHGAIIGLLSGAVSGALLGLGAGQDHCSNAEFVCFGIDRGTAAAGFGVLLGALGAGIGAAAAPGEKWETVGSAHVNVSVLPVHRGARIAVAVRF
jgi:hypothetical protein